MNRTKVSEEDLAAKVVGWLGQFPDYEVYQEVQRSSGGRIADIVVVHGSMTWIIEVKKSYGLAVVEQATHWIGSANYVSVAVPAPVNRRNRETDWAIRHFHSFFGLGHISISHSGCYQTHAPKLHRLPKRSFGLHISEWVSDAHKTYAPAGNAAGRRWTPFQQTCDNLRAIVRGCPGITFKEAVQQVDHHYASETSAVGSLRTWIHAGKIPGVRFGAEKRPLRLYLDEAA